MVPARNLMVFPVFCSLESSAANGPKILVQRDGDRETTSFLDHPRLQLVCANHELFYS